MYMRPQYSAASSGDVEASSACSLTVAVNDLSSERMPCVHIFMPAPASGEVGKRGVITGVSIGVSTRVSTGESTGVSTGLSTGESTGVSTRVPTGMSTRRGRIKSAHLSSAGKTSFQRTNNANNATLIEAK